MTITQRIKFSDQLRLLIDLHTTGSERVPSVKALAQAMNISDQTLLNLLDGSAASPRLETARAICSYYGITLDYFDCETEAACRDYLARHQLRGSPLLQAIDEETAELSPRGKRNVLSLLEWVRRAKSRRS